MKTAATIVLTVVLLLFVCCPAGANVFADQVAITIIREQSTEFGYDTNAYSDRDLLDFLHTIPSGELEEFKESYARRPDLGTAMTAQLEEINRVEFERERVLLGKWISAWEKSRTDSRPLSGSPGEPGDFFASNY